MKLLVSCQKCGKSYNVDEQWAGKRTRCRGCGESMRVPPAPIELGPIDGPIPMPPAYKEVTPPEPKRVKVKVASQGSQFKDARKTRLPSPTMPTDRRSRKPLSWISLIFFFVLGGATVGIVVVLANAMLHSDKPIVVLPALATVEVKFLGAFPDNQDELRRRTMEIVTAQLEGQGVKVVNDNKQPCVRVVATLLKAGEFPTLFFQDKPTTMPASGPATQPETPAIQISIKELKIDILVEVYDAYGVNFWRVRNQGGQNLSPERLPRTPGKSLADTIQENQWLEACERFKKINYPTASEVQQNEVNKPAATTAK